MAKRNEKNKRTLIVSDSVTGQILEHSEVDLPKINSITGFLKGEWDLDRYSECFSGNNRLGDLDGSLEIDGSHLVLEFKEHMEAMNKGQLVKAIRMAKHCNTTTFFIFGRTNQPKKKIIISPKTQKPNLSDTDEEELKALLKEWNRKAKIRGREIEDDLAKDWEAAGLIFKKINYECMQERKRLQY